MHVSDLFLKCVRGVILGVLIAIVALGVAHGQNAGVVGIQAQMISVFTAQTTNKSSGGIWQCGVSSGVCPVFQDIGAGLNLLIFCGAGNAIYTIDLDFQPVGQTSFKIIPGAQASYSSDSTCHTLQIGGYFPNLRSTLTISTGNVTAWYSGSSAPTAYTAPAIGSNGPTSPASCDQDITANVTTGSTVSVLGATNVTLGQTTVICGMTISFQAATTGGNIELQWSNNSTCTGGANGWEELTPSTAPQYLTVPLTLRGPGNLLQQPCIVNSSGATAVVTVMLATVTI